MFHDNAQLVLCYEKYIDVFVIFINFFLSFSPRLNFISNGRHFVL